jgi:hypothetical protein
MVHCQLAASSTQQTCALIMIECSSFLLHNGAHAYPQKNCCMHSPGMSFPMMGRLLLLLLLAAAAAGCCWLCCAVH